MQQMCTLLLQKWSTLKELHYILDVPYKATIRLQKRNLTLSDVYGIWLEMRLHVEALCNRKSLKTTFAQCLLAELNAQNGQIFDNPLMSCALYLDPRFHLQISKNREKTEEVQNKLNELWKRIQFRKSNVINNSENSENSVSLNESSFDFDPNRAVAAYLCTQQNDLETTVTRNDHPPSIELIIELFQPEIKPVNYSVLQYWEEKIEEHKELYEIAQVVFSVPPTEVQIERDFSRLNHVFGHKRCNLAEERLMDIMAIHLNDEIFYIVKEKEVMALRAEIELRK